MSIWHQYARYINRRMFIIFLLGISSGLPLALVGGTLQAWYKTTGVDLITIGFLALLGQPYSYKMFWAPLLDRYKPPFLGRRRGWILFTQSLIITVIVAMALCQPQHQPLILGCLGLLLATCSATQDTVIDAYKIELLSADERGLGSALGIEGYRLGMLLSGGLAMILADRIGWQSTYLIMAGLMVLGMLATYAAEEPAAPAETTPPSLFEAIYVPFREFLTRYKAGAFLLFVVFYKLGDAFAGALSTAFLLDIGFSLTDVGTINKVIGLLSTLAGILVGGFMMTRISLFKALCFFGGLQAITNLAYMALALVGKNYSLAVGAFFIENICGGMGQAALCALLMSLCCKKYAATQYALFASLTAVGRVYVGPLSGYIVQSLGWANFFFCSMLFALPGLIILWTLKGAINNRENVVDEDSATQSEPLEAF